jgi:hypothetical protein
MHVAVCVKQIPDTSAPQALRPDDGTLDRSALTAVFNELGEYAIEGTLQPAEAAAGSVTGLTMRREKAAEVLHSALQLYVALSISGAIQPVAGMSDARNVVAINRDTEAPILKFADLAVVGDPYEAVPALIGAPEGRPA